MRGLKQYLRKHGAHFTEELVNAIMPIKWKYEEIEASIGSKVWYNCWSATSGDILYLVNSDVFDNKKRALKRTMETLGDYSQKYSCFVKWLEDCSIMDITPYI